MSPAKSQIQQLLEKALAEYCFSGYQLFVEARGKTLSLHGGITSYWPDSEPVTARTLFDIGSITKAVVTGSCFARRNDPLEATLGEKMAAFKGTKYDGLSLRALLSHSAGVRWWYPLFEATTREGLPAWFLKEQDLVCEGRAGTRAVYSDLGFLLLGFILGDCEKAFQQEVAGPLSLKEVMYGPLGAKDVAATEYCLRRGRVLKGEIFDENCAHLGGKCPHAGLFATAEGLAPWAREWMRASRGQSKWIAHERAADFTRVANPQLGTWGLGWDTKSPTGSSAGSKFSSRSFGHLGYPGCSVWIDPEHETYALFFTNRVHPSRNDERIRGLRPLLHDAIADWAAST